MALRLALVADEPDFRSSMSELLQSLECEVVPFENGGALLEQLEQSRFGGVLLDLPPTDAGHLEIAKRIRSSSLNGQAPIALVSDPSAANEMRPAFDAGINVFLSKPLHREAVRKALNMFVAPIARKKRRYTRVPFSANVVCRNSSGQWQLQGVDVSAMGMLLEGTDALRFGDEAQLEFFLPGSRDPLKVAARVTRREPRSRVAFVFTDIPANHQQQIQQFISAYGSTNKRRR